LFSSLSWHYNVADNTSGASRLTHVFATVEQLFEAGLTLVHFRLNVSAFCETRGAFRRWAWGVLEVLGGLRGGI
jgi:hypothetical protein